MQFIRILNSNSMRMNFWVYYNEMHQATQSSVHTPFFKKGQYEEVNLPEFANNITLKVYVEKSPGSRSLAFTISIRTRNSKCYELLGATTLKLNEIKCDAIKNQGFISFQNGTSTKMKCQLLYTSGKEGFKDESNELTLNEKVSFSIPVSAEYIQFNIMKLESSGKWTVVKSFKSKVSSIRKCYISKLEKQSITIAEVKCESITGVIGSPVSVGSSIPIVNLNNMDNGCCCCCKCCCSYC